MPRTVTFREVGAPNTPQEIKRLRRENMDMCRRMGQPVIVRHVYGPRDVDTGIAQTCPACYDADYDHVRGDCPVCYGEGFASVELNTASPLIYINTDGFLTQTATPDPSWIVAPQYGGFGVPYLTWLVEPDVAVDVFRITDQGVMTQQFDAQGFAPWTPTLGDNDLCINVEVDKSGFNIVKALDRFQLKKVQQVTIRGFGRRAKPGSLGQPLLVAQTFEMNKVLDNTILNNVPYDEPWY